MITPGMENVAPQEPEQMVGDRDRQRAKEQAERIISLRDRLIGELRNDIKNWDSQHFSNLAEMVQNHSEDGAVHLRDAELAPADIYEVQKAAFSRYQREGTYYSLREMARDYPELSSMTVDIRYYMGSDPEERGELLVLPDGSGVQKLRNRTGLVALKPARLGAGSLMSPEHVDIVGVLNDVNDYKLVPQEKVAAVIRDEWLPRLRERVQREKQILEQIQSGQIIAYEDLEKKEDKIARDEEKIAKFESMVAGAN